MQKLRAPLSDRAMSHWCHIGDLWLGPMLSWLVRENHIAGLRHRWPKKPFALAPFQHGFPHQLPWSFEGLLVPIPPSLQASQACTFARAQHIFQCKQSASVGHCEAVGPSDLQGLLALGILRLTLAWHQHPSPAKERLSLKELFMHDSNPGAVSTRQPPCTCCCLCRPESKPDSRSRVNARRTK